MKKLAFIVFILLSLFQVSFLVWGSEGTAKTQLIAVCCAAFVGLCLLVWIIVDKKFASIPIALIIILAFFLRLVAIHASPLLEDDHYRYLWDGFRSVTSLNPYYPAPSHFFTDVTLSEFWQDILFSINYPEVPTIYGPVLQGLFALGYWLAPGNLIAIQSLLLMVDMGIFLLLVWQKIPARWLLVYAIHPLILKESMASAHPDIIVGGFLLLALIAWQCQHAYWVGSLLALAMATKISALIVVPFLLIMPPKKNLLWSVKALFSCILILGLCYAPFLLQGASDANALKVFGNQWQFNPLLFRGINAITNLLSFDLMITKAFAAVLLLLSLSGLFFVWRLRYSDKPPPIDYAVLLLLLFSPVVNPWYALWIIAPALFLRRYLLAASLSVFFLAYLNSSVLMDAGLISSSLNTQPFWVSWPLTVIQIAVLVIVLWMGFRDTRFCVSV
jgi:alpha-1,6-mannosyltransferase